MAYTEKYHVIYCDRNNRQFRLGISEWDWNGVELFRRGHFNNVEPSEIGIYKEGFDFSFLQVGDTLIVSESTSNDGTYTVTGFHNSVPPDDPYIRIQLSPQVPVQIDEDVKITIIPKSRRLKAGPVPFAKTEEISSELKTGGIFPTRATVTLVSSATFSMEELYTADERKYLISHEPADGSDEGKWYGNVIPNGFTEEMDNDVHYMILTASDNLPTLKLKLFEESPGLNYGAVGSMIEGDFFQSFLWVAKEAFKKTDFLLPIYTMVDIMPQLPGESKTVSVFVIGDSGAGTITMYDDGISDMLEVGSKITVNWDEQSIAYIYTVQSWTVFSQWGGNYVAITTDEVPENIGAPAVIEVANPVDVSTLADPLAITVHDLRTYVRDQDIEGKNYYEISGSAMSTWDVLNNLAKQWNAKIYQNNGRWEIVRWNAFMKAGEGYEYFVYNAEGTQIGREPFGEVIDYPCKSTKARFRPFGHAIGMDRVLGAVGVNYVYKFKTDGDSLVNLIQNGNFGNVFIPGAPAPSTDPSVFTPARWVRNISTLSPTPNPYGELLIEQVLSPNLGEKFAPGINSFIKITGRSNDLRFLSSDTGYPTPVNSGDELRIKWWHRVTWWVKGFGSPRFYRYSVLRIMVVADSGEVYCLVNGGPTSYYGESPLSPTAPVKALSQWHKVEGGVYPVFISNAHGADTPNPLSAWTLTQIDTPPCPITGRIVVEIVGAGAATAFAGETNRLPSYFYAYFPGSNGMERKLWGASDTETHLTGVFIAKIVDPSNEKVQQLHPYWYENDGAYTDSIDDIEVLTGDDNNLDHVSNIYVMDGVTRRAVNQWDTWANDFGWGALGLIVAKSVMQQYYRPWRIIDGAFAAEKWHWSNLITFEERPGEVYAILRGTISPINNQLNGTIVQIYDANTPELLPGGNDGGNTIDPIWQQTGTIRCTRDEDGENTGRQESLQVDINPASQTYQQTRWVDFGENTDACPIGEPVQLYWGEQAVLDVDGLRYYPYEKDIDAYTVTYSNDGGGAYLRLLHLASLGTVQSILYAGNYESISGWVYEADEVINGYTYKHLRLSWLTGVYSDLPVIFVIN